MISGAHVAADSKDAKAGRAFFGLASVDARHGCPIFALPAAEAVLHPAGEDRRELCFMCGGVNAEMAALSVKASSVRGQ